MRSIRLIALAAAMLWVRPAAQANQLQLVELALRHNSSLLFDIFPTLGETAPALAGLNLSNFNTSTGVGDIVYTITTPGIHYFVGFFDHQVVANGTPNTFTNETGALLAGFSTPGAGQVAEVNDNCLGGGACAPSVYDRAVSTSGGVQLIQNAPGVLVGPTDIAMAMGWSLTLMQNQIATLTLRITCTQVALGCDVSQPHLGTLVLGQNDPLAGGGSDLSVFLSGNVVITGDSDPIPEPRTTALLAAALGGVMRLAKNRKRT